MLVDVRPLGVTGKEADLALGEVRITVNRNTIPYDPNPPMVASGIRVGTPAVTGRGMQEAEMGQVAQLIVDGIAARGDEAAQAGDPRPGGADRRSFPGAGPAGDARRRTGNRLAPSSPARSGSAILAPSDRSESN